MSIHVLFVCLGNICRSPMAEAVFQQLVDEAGLSAQFEIDSAGTGSWHVGERPHRGTRRILREHNVNYAGRARQIQASDIRPDTYLVAMDKSNLNEITRRFGDHPRLYRLLDFAANSIERDVPDPYYSGNFEHVYQLVKDGCHGLLEMIQKKEGI